MEEQKKEYSEGEEQTGDSRVFDDVFRTMLERIPEVMIPLINEVFGTNYAEDETITQLKNEHYLKGGTVVTDCLLDICGKQYHLECQSNPDNTIALRMIEYDIAIALQNVITTEFTDGGEHDYEMSFPSSCVFYLRHNNRTKKKACVRIRFQDGTFHMYEMPIVKVQEYGKEEIFEKKLLAFLPYYFMRYEKSLHGISENEEMCGTLIAEFLDIRKHLSATVKEEKGVVYSELVSHINKIAEYLLRNEPKAKERMEAIVMGGQVYETLTDKFLMEGEARGEARGENQGKIMMIDNMVSSGICSFEKACEIGGIEPEEYENIKKELETRKLEEEKKKQKPMTKEEELFQRQINRIYKSRMSF